MVIKVVSLFDGISCGRVALERTGIAVSTYSAFEIDKYAKAISRHNYPDIEQRGDVLHADFNHFAGSDLVMGGSPCTFWSIAKTNREIDKDGMGWTLFMRFVDAVRRIQPRYFLYENVASMPVSIKAYISEELGCEPVFINSALVSAQQRKRLYWTNIGGITQPADRGINRLFVDESHAYKNLFLVTKMRNVAGLSTSEAQKSVDMFMKCRYMDEITDGKGVIYATGTPICAHYLWLNMA